MIKFGFVCLLFRCFNTHLLQGNLRHWCIPEDSKIDQEKKLITVEDHLKPVALQCPHPLSDGQYKVVSLFYVVFLLRYIEKKTTI